MRGYIIGIDPGALGGIAVLDGTSGEVVDEEYWEEEDNKHKQSW